MPNITGHTELVGLMAYPIRHTQSPTTHNLAYDKNGDDVTWNFCLRPTAVPATTTSGSTAKATPPG